MDPVPLNGIWSKSPPEPQLPCEKGGSLFNQSLLFVVYNLTLIIPSMSPEKGQHLAKRGSQKPYHNAHKKALSPS